MSWPAIGTKWRTLGDSSSPVYVLTEFVARGDEQLALLVLSPLSTFDDCIAEMVVCWQWFQLRGIEV